MKFELSPMQEKVMRELASDGASNKAIAGRLGIKASTVRIHLQGAMTRLGAGNRTQAAMLWRERNG